MVELKPKDPDAPKGAAPAPAPETAKVPTETACANNGITIKTEGDHTELRMSRYIAEHIGAFRTCSFVVIKFKHGQVPDITAISER